MASPRKPDYRVAIMNKDTDEKNSRAGAAWLNPDGTIQIVLEGFITFRGGKEILMTLFPNKEK